MELGKVALREAQLLHFDGGLSLGHWHGYLLLGVEFVVWLTGWETVVVHDGGAMMLLLSRHVVTLGSWLVGSLLTTLVVASSLLVSAAALVVASLTAATLLVLALAAAVLVLVVVVLLAGLVSTHVATLTAGVVIHLISAFGLIANFFSMSDPIHHLVRFLLLTFVLKLLLADPEIDGDGSVSERRHLVEVLDGELGMVDILVQDESLFVGRLGVVGVDAELD
jgi:hypothetical protein